jgi:hypothetical protein
MRTVIVALIAAVAAFRAAAQASPVIVDVCGAKKLNWTPLTVKQGDKLHFEVIGSSPRCKDDVDADPRLVACDRPECAKWADGRMAPVDANGWERLLLRPFFFLKRVRTARWYELTGAVGHEPFLQTFPIGTNQNQVTIDADGELFLFANDASWRYQNNHGSLRVRITRAD